MPSVRSSLAVAVLALLALQACVAAPVGRVAANNSTTDLDLDLTLDGARKPPTPTQCRRAKAALDKKADALANRFKALARVCRPSVSGQNNSTVVNDLASTELAGVDGVDGRKINCRRAKAALDKAAAELRRRFAALARVCKPTHGDEEGEGEEETVSLASDEDAQDLEGVDGCDGKRVRCRRAKAALDQQAAALKRRAAVLRRVCTKDSEEETLTTDEDAEAMADVDGVDGRKINCRRAKAALDKAAAELRRRFAALARVCKPTHGDEEGEGEEETVSLASDEDAQDLEGVDGCDGKRVRCRRAKAALDQQAAALKRRAAVLRRVCTKDSEEETLTTDEDAEAMADVDGVDGRKINCRRAKAALDKAAAELRRRFAALARVCKP